MAYNAPKTAQIAARLLNRGGGTLNVVKLMKLLYLVDREALKTMHRPLTGDRMVSMPRGPVLSRTYEVSQGQYAACDGGWDSWMADRENHMISLRDNVVPSREALTELSDADIAIVDQVWAQFGQLNEWDLVQFTHDRCAEWVDPNGSSARIDYVTVLRAVGKSPEEAARIAAEIESSNYVDSVLAGL